ncbi:two-component hybrid sensor and regulator [Ectothiorhodospira sp. PHS-1]|uniref:ATP-binding protein n=1 Tax=Ectothiorhodospira sp. PHS-1 TaxID=519989 RepID=UPI00024A855A|nr:ATP-binding protein [Ectothiorhodospira sp. PHS-1]EHQ51699.1 two-component hybrid sensor and regulator [Ectothiorhodospira sp. PHS-1]
MRRLEATQILYEIALSVGQSLDLNQMLRHSLGTMMRLCNFNLAVVMRLIDETSQGVTGTVVAAIPRNVVHRTYYQAFMERAEVPEHPDALHGWLMRLPLHREDGEAHHWYMFHLTGFGILVLRKTGTPISEDLFNSLPKLMEKLSQAIRACIYEQELKQQMEAARSAERAKNLFMANISHEIRTPMNGVLGLLDVVLDTPLPEEVREQLNLARLSAEHLLGIINIVLDLSRIDAGKMVLEARDLDLKELLLQTLGSQMPSAAAKQLKLTHHLDSDLPDYVRVDATRLRQILINLIGNAIKFTEQGEVSLQGQLLARDEAASEIQLSIRDTGIGIPTHVISRIFEAFEQGDNTYSRRFEGTGLGLTITHKLVELLGGEITVNSEAGKGSEFTVRLRLPHGTQPATDDTLTPHVLLADQLRKMRLKVLVAEDNSINQLVIRKLLERIHAASTVAENGIETVELASHRRFDLILMDMMMPLMDGMEATQHIRQQEAENHWSPCPIIALTAHAMAGDRERFLASGMQGYVAKPIQYTLLVQEILKVIGDHPHPGDQQRPSGHLDISDIHTENEPTWFLEAVNLSPSVSHPSPAELTHVLNWHNALKQIGGDEPLLRQVLALFMEGIDGQMHGMWQSLATSDINQLGIQAHTLKGQCGTLCALPARDAAQQLEKLCRDQTEVPRIRQALHALQEQMDRLLPALRHRQDAGPGNDPVTPLR